MKQYKPDLYVKLGNLQGRKQENKTYLLQNGKKKRKEKEFFILQQMYR